MKNKIVGTGAFTFFVAAVYMIFCFLCTYISSEGYVRMSQEIVEQSIDRSANR